MRGKKGDETSKNKIRGGELCFLLGCMVYKYTDFGNLTTLTKVM